MLGFRYVCQKHRQLLADTVTRDGCNDPARPVPRAMDAPVAAAELPVSGAALDACYRKLSQPTARSVAKTA